MNFSRFNFMLLGAFAKEIITIKNPSTTKKALVSNIIPMLELGALYASISHTKAWIVVPSKCSTAEHHFSTWPSLLYVIFLYFRH